MQINLRSPFFVSATDENLEYLKLELFVYTGTKNTDRTAVIYTLETDNEFTFEISELAREYLDVLFSGTYIEQNIWVDYRLTKTISGVITVGSYVNLEGYYGYGYFEDGANPQILIDLLQDNNKIFVPINECFSIPIKTNGLVRLELFYDDGTTETQTVTFDQNESDKLTYYLVNCPDAEDIEYLFQDGDNYLFQDGIQFLFVKGGGFNKVIFDYGDYEKEVKIIKLEECKYIPKKVTFINKYGMLQDLWMFKNMILSLNTNEDSYKKNILNLDSYSTTDHENQTLKKQGKEKLISNSGYYPENFNEIFKQLLLSDKVWLTEGDTTLPVNIDNSTFNFKDRLYDKLINYTIDFSYAFDTINKIR